MNALHYRIQQWEEMIQNERNNAKRIDDFMGDLWAQIGIAQGCITAIEKDPALALEKYAAERAKTEQEIDALEKERTEVDAEAAKVRERMLRLSLQISSLRRRLGTLENAVEVAEGCLPPNEQREPCTNS